MIKKILAAILVVFVSVLSNASLVVAQTATPSPSSSTTPSVTPTPDTAVQQKQYQDLQQKINELEGKVSAAQQQGRTLAAQISQMDNQIKLTEFKIDATKSEIVELTKDIASATKKITTLEDSLNEITKVLLKRIVATYQVGSMPSFQMMLSSNSAADFLKRTNYLKLVQAHDKRLIYDTQQARNDYQNQKNIFEAKKQKVVALSTQLEKYSDELDNEKDNKTSLLAATKNDEATYQKLLTQAREQISSFKSFATAQGGSILPAQASPDGWYYNQRDERWGRNNIGRSGDKIWEVGCLLTSVAMVLKKHGENVTPADVGSNSSYYFSDTASMLVPWGGGKFQSIWQRDLNAIDAKLSSGEPVIVGVRVSNSVGTHFIVLKSGSNGSYKVNDPWYGYDINFSDYYSTGQIFQYGYYKG